MANRYWVGGTANWDGTAGTKWSTTSGGAGGAAVPTSSDDVFFDANSGGSTVAILGTAIARSVTCTGFTGQLTSGTLFLYGGNLTYSATMSGSNAGPDYTYINGNCVITTAGKTLAPNSSGILSISASSGTVSLADNLTLGNTSTLEVLSGTFTTTASNYSISAGYFSSVSSLSRTISLNGSLVNLFAGGNTTLNFTSNSGLTFNAGTSNITLQANGPYMLTGPNSLTFNNVTFQLTGSNDSYMSGPLVFNNLTVVPYSSYCIPFYVKNNITVNGTLNVSSASVTTRVFLSSENWLNGSVVDVTAAAVSATNCDFRCISITGAASPISPTGAGNCGSNAGITFPVSKTVYWNLAGSNLWTDNGWATTSGGSPATSNFPLAQDTAVIDDNGAATAITLYSGHNIGTLNCGSRTIPVSLDFYGKRFCVYGSLTMGSGVTLTSSSPAVDATFSPRSATVNITSAGKVFPWNVWIASAGNTVQLSDNFETTATTYVAAGTLDLNNFNFTTSSASLGNVFAGNTLISKFVAFSTSGQMTLTGNSKTIFSNTGNAVYYTGTSNVVCNYTGSVGFRTIYSSSTESNSFSFYVTGGSDTISLSTSANFKNLNFTGFSGTLSPNVATTIYGDLTISSGMSLSSTSLSTSFASSTTQNVTSNGKTFNFPVSKTGVGTLTMLDNLTLGTSRTFTLSSGTLNLNGFNLSVGVFDSSNSTARSISFGSNNIALTSTTASTTVLSMATATNFTFTGTGAFTRNMAATATVSFGISGGTTSNAPNLTVSAGSSQLDIGSGSYFKNVNFTGSTCDAQGTYYACGDLTLASGGTYSTLQPYFITSATLTGAGKTLANTEINGTGITVTLNGSCNVGTGSTFFLTEGTLDLNGNALSVGSFSSAGSSARSIAFGSANIALSSTVPGTIILGMSVANNFTYTGTGGFTRNMTNSATVQFGSVSGGTTSNAPNLTVTGGSLTLTITSGSYLKNLVFTGGTSTVTASNLNVAGNLTLASGGTYTAVVPTFVASGTITSNGKTLGNTTINGSGITITLADALTLGSTRTLTLTQGTFTANNQNVSTPYFNSSNTNTRTLNMGSGTWTISGSPTIFFPAWETTTTTNLTLNANTSTISMTNASAKTFAGGGLTYYNLNQGGSGTLTISGSNTFNDITNSVQPATVSFTSGTTQTVSNFSLLGTAGNLITVNSTSAGSQASLSKASGIVSVNYLSIRDSNATGGAQWYAGTNSTNVSNNTGWIFTAPPPSGFGNFLAFFT
jgi:hypothetical protein